jgi:hypothetical protein
MTNYEKYKDELLKHVIARADIGLEIHTNKLIDCSDLHCEKCKFNANGMFMCKNVREMEKWLNSEYVEEEKEKVDWSKVPIGTMILVSNDGVTWYRRYFAGIDTSTDEDLAWSDDSMSWVNCTTQSWKYAKLYKGDEE